MTKKPKIDFTPISAENLRAEVVRLVQAKEGVVLVSSHTASNPTMGATTVFSALSLKNYSSSWSAFATLNQVVPSAPMWDAASDASHKIQLAFEKPGGAINALLVQDSSGSRRSITQNDPLRSFSLPRFTRPSAESPHWLTAVVDNRDCVAVPLVGKTPLQQLGACSEGLLLHFNGGFVFVYKTSIPGPVRGNRISPGHLHLAMLDSDLRPIKGERENDLFEGTMFEFDADTVRNKLVIVATTPTGMEILAGSVEGNVFKLERHEFPMTPSLTSPAVVTNNSDKAFMAVLASSKTGSTRILIAESPISALETPETP